MTDEPEELEDPGFTEDDHDENPPNDIVSYNELRSCADLFRMHDEGILKINPDFQRDVVWPPKVDKILPDYLERKNWLRQHGAALDV